jgi:hypothetical protein
MLEQCINMRLNLNLQNLSISILRDVLRQTLEHILEELNIQNIENNNMELVMQKDFAQNLPFHTKQLIR